MTLPLDAPPLTTAQQAVLDALRKGPQTMRTLNSITPVWFSALSTLRGAGHQIISDTDARGLRVWTLYDQGGL